MARQTFNDLSLPRGGQSTLLRRIFPAIALLASAISTGTQAADDSSLVGAWRLVQIDDVDASGKVVRHKDLKGSLIYTREGRLSVQVISPSEDVTTDYMLNGYEASYGRYTVDPKNHQVTHHVEGANQRELIGANLSRRYQICGRQLIIGPVNTSEHWSVIWERE